MHAFTGPTSCIETFQSTPLVAERRCTSSVTSGSARVKITCCANRFVFKHEISYVRVALAKKFVKSDECTARESHGEICALGVRANLQNQRGIEVSGAETAMFTYFIAFQFSDAVEAQVVFFRLDFRQQIPL